MGFFESIIKIAGEDGKLGDIVKTVTEGGSVGDLINVATDNGSIGDLIKKVAKKNADEEEVYDDSECTEEEVDEEEEYDDSECTEDSGEDGEEVEEDEEASSKKGFGDILGSILKNQDLGEIAKSVIGIIGLAGGAKRAKA